MRKTRRNAMTRWKKHGKLKENSKPANKITLSPMHIFIKALEIAPQLIDTYHHVLEKHSNNDQKHEILFYLEMV